MKQILLFSLERLLHFDQNKTTTFFYYSYEACFKGEIVFTGYGRQIIPSNRIVQSTKTTLLTYPDPTISLTQFKDGTIFC